ncbi:MAG: DUF2490 domain-containing protein [Crocinitomicaceae bacterium]|nr:DUF2490 domain-containing protein [Crocinitomicaceae bacterium]
MRKLGIIIVFLMSTFLSKAQVNEHEVGAWYMYFWDTEFKESGWGIQGDFQLRKWNIFGDLEQLLLRSGVTYSPKNAKVKFTLGYGDITSGTYGDSKATTRESRIYQEVLMPHKVGNRFYFRHRIRYEQRFVEQQDFRTRYRYAMFLTVPFNKNKIGKGAFYLSLYDEIFINGQRDIGNGYSVALYDRNRAYAALGYGILDNLNVQLGYMQQTTSNWNKGQLQLSLHHKIKFSQKK